jgi:hypothetical protein
MGADAHPPATNLLEEASQVVLKDHDDHHDRQRHEPLEHPGGELETQLPHEQGRPDQQHQADQDQTRSRTQPAKPCPDHGGHEQDVEQVDDAKIGDQLMQLGETLESARAPPPPSIRGAGKRRVSDIQSARAPGITGPRAPRPGRITATVR